MENCLERAVILARGGLIAPPDLPPAIQNLSVGLSLQEAEKALILKTLEDAGGNRAL